MRILILSIILLGILFVGCQVNETIDSDDGFVSIEKQVKSLPIVGSADRFISFETMLDSENDLKIIAKALALSFNNIETRKGLHQLLKEKDVFGEISFNDFILLKNNDQSLFYNTISENGVSDFEFLLNKHPELRLSIPLKYEKSFDAFSDFIIAVSPIIDEQYVTEIVAFDLNGNKIVLAPVELSTIPILVLEIDENPNNHPKVYEDAFVADENGNINIPSHFNNTLKTLTHNVIEINRVKMYNKLEGTWNRAEFNGTVTVGTMEGAYDYEYDFPTTTTRWYGITGVNWDDRYYDVDKYQYTIGDTGFDGDYSVLGFTFWEDDPGGEEPSYYYPPSSQASGGCNDYVGGYLDTHNSPDDLFGYAWIEYADCWNLPIDSKIGITRYLYGYSGGDGGNYAYNCDDFLANKNAYVTFYVRD
ncbi:MAG: hypothetical protein H8E98_04385 [Bacteroidetes bacterium]|nr:hypothetical protein [Bacteroidota bacterium]